MAEEPYAIEIAHLLKKASEGKILSNDRIYQYLLGKSNVASVARVIASVASKVVQV